MVENKEILLGGCLTYHADPSFSSEPINLANRPEMDRKMSDANKAHPISKFNHKKDHKGVFQLSV